MSKNDLGKKWDVLNAFGKFFTWLVGFKWFARRVEFPSQDICINRVIKWWIIGFGAELRGRHYSEWTTHSFYKYVKNNPDKFEIVYEKFKHE